MTPDNSKKNFDDIFIPGDKSLSISELEEVFTGKGIDAKKLREDAWKRGRRFAIQMS